ncbi:MAG: ABC transporter permease, partial [Pseudomonadota bacterium]
GVHADEERHSESLAATIAELPLLREAEVLSWRQAAPELAPLIDMKGMIDFIFLAILFFAAAAGIANTMMMSTFERTREIGMLLAVGMRPRRVVKLVLVEAVVLGLIGVAIGSAIGAALVLVTSHTGIPYHALSGTQAEETAFAGINVSYTIFPRLHVEHFFEGFVAVALTALLAATWPAIMASRVSPVEAMRS